MDLTDSTRPLDVHMAYSICDFAHGGGWVGTIKFGPLMAARGINWKIWCMKTDPENIDEYLGVPIHKLSGELTEGEPGADHSAIKAAISAAFASRSQGRASLVVPGSWGWGSMRMLWSARLKGIRFAFDPQIMPDPLPSSKWPRLKSLCSQRLLMSPINYYFALSHELRRTYCHRYGVPEKRVLIKENGVDLVRFRPPANQEKMGLRAALGLPTEGKMVLFCGSVVHRKGVDLLMRAWKSVQAVHPSAILVLRGSLGYRPTYESNGLSNALCAFTSEIHRLHESLPNPGNVIFAGHGADMESYYRAADLFVFPSRLEGLPYVLFEAMACGLPCVIAPFVGMPRDGEELGIAGTHYLKSSHEPDSISAEVIHALQNPDKLRDIATASRRWMEQSQDLEVIADKSAVAFRIAAGL